MLETHSFHGRHFFRAWLSCSTHSFYSQVRELIASSLWGYATNPKHTHVTDATNLNIHHVTDTTNSKHAHVTDATNVKDVF